jgi:hypothetical protein
VKITRVMLFAAVTVMAAVPAFAQTDTAGTAATATATATGATAIDPTSIQQNLEGVLEEPSSESEYHYDPAGRRDPFRSLIGSKDVGRGGPPGVAGFLIEELDLQGVVRTKQGLVGMVTGPDNNGYTLRVGDKVFDGEVVRITQAAIVFRQETREIVKELTPQTDRRR